jgi:hypothetical protein
MKNNPHARSTEMTDAPIIKSMTLPVRFHTSVSTYVGPDGETQVWQGSASVCGQTIADIHEYHGVRTEKALLIRLTEQVRDINREHLNRVGA